MHYPSHHLKSIAVVSILCACSIGINAQTKPNAPTQDPASRPEKRSASSDDDLPFIGPMEEEMRAKRAIKLADKEYQDNLARAREATRLSWQLRDTYKEKKSLSPEDSKKLDRLEKLERRIRSEAGGSGEEALSDESPMDLATALVRLAELTESLEKSLTKTSRKVISAGIIDEANVILELIKFARKFPH
jgi:hypothetical protein